MDYKLFRNKLLLCAHNVTFSGYYGKTMRSIVFMDEDGETYIWVTGSETGVKFIEGQFYNISAKCNERRILNWVKIIETGNKSYPSGEKPKSEQPDHSPVDVFNLIYGVDDKICYTLDKRLKKIYNKNERW